jgi:hypothetical protein
MLKRSAGRSLVAVLAVVVVIVSGMVSAASASARGTSRASLGEASGPSDALMRDARWVTIQGQRVLVAPVSATAEKASAAPGSVVPWGSLKDVGTGLCLSSYPDEVGHAVEQWPCNGSYNQNWAYVVNGAGRSLENEGMIVNTPVGPEFGCLDNRGGVVFENGNPQIMWPCEGRGWNLGLVYAKGVAQRPGTVLIHTNDFYYHDGKTWCVTSYPNMSPGSALAEWVCNKYSPNQSFVGGS